MDRFDFRTMKRISLLLALCGVMLVSCGKEPNGKEPETGQPESLTFAAATYSYANAERPYRRADINLREGITPAVVLYLHGGSARGTDNEKQLSEPGVGSIAAYLQQKGIPAVFLVPQCPETDAQGKSMAWIRMAGALEYLIGTCRTDASAKVYVFGGSMGGTGTWNLLSACPGLFTAAMACAGNPKGCDAAAVALTPVYAVMGSADRIMKPEEVNLQAFLDQVAAAGGQYLFDTEEGWDHETTCKESYTESRLDWIFSW